MRKTRQAAEKCIYTITMENFEVSFNMNDYITVGTNDMIETFETEGKLLSEY